MFVVSILYCISSCAASLYIAEIINETIKNKLSNPMSLCSNLYSKLDYSQIDANKHAAQVSTRAHWIWHF